MLSKRTVNKVVQTKSPIKRINDTNTQKWISFKLPIILKIFLSSAKNRLAKEKLMRKLNVYFDYLRDFAPKSMYFIYLMNQIKGKPSHAKYHLR